MSRKLLPYLSLAIGILALSITAMFVRWAGAPGPITAFYRLAFSTLILAPFFARRGPQQAAAGRAHLIFPILGGIFTSLDFSFWNTSTLYTTASNATLLGNTAPLWVALFAWLALREKLKGKFWVGLALALSGAVLVMGRDFLTHSRLGIGDLLAICAGVFYAGYLLSTQHGRRYFPNLTQIWLMGASATVSLLFINLLLRNPFWGYPPQTWLIFLLTAVVSQIIGYQAISYALGHLPASVVAPTMIGQPVMTTILAIPLLHEIPQPVQLLGGIAVLAGVYLVHQSHSQNRVEELEP
jgi:drug/metabolite transporter (DMT)-like permease